MKLSENRTQLVSLLIARMLLAFALCVLLAIGACGGSSDSEHSEQEVQRVLTRLEVHPVGMVLTGSVATQQLTVSAFDQFGAIMSTPALQFSSTDPSVSVSAAGLVRAEADLGSASIVVRSGTVVALPVPALVAKLKAGAVTFDDDKARSPVEALPGTASGSFLLRATIAPDIQVGPGAILVPTGEYPLAGRVLSVSETAAGRQVVVERVALQDIFSDLDVRLHYGPDQLGTIVVKENGTIEGLMQAKKSRHADSMIPCGQREVNLLTLKSSVTLERSLDVESRIVGGSHKESTVVASAKVDAQLTAGLPGLGGADLTLKLECAIPLGKTPLPLPGALNIVFGHEIEPALYASLEFDTSTGVFLNLSATTTWSGKVKVGYKITEAGTEVIGGLDLGSPTLSGDAATAADVRVGAKLFAGLRFTYSQSGFGYDFDLLEAKFGLVASGNWGTPGDVATATDYSAGYKISKAFEAELADGAKSLLTGISASASELIKVQITASEDLARSPRLKDARIESPLDGPFKAGQNVRIGVGVQDTEFLGRYNIAALRLYRISGSAISHTATLLQQVEVADSSAALNADGFVIDWVADQDLGPSDRYFVFVVPKILETVGRWSPFPLGPVKAVLSPYIYKSTMRVGCTSETLDPSTCITSLDTEAAFVYDSSISDPNVQRHRLLPGGFVRGHVGAVVGCPFTVDVQLTAELLETMQSPIGAISTLDRDVAAMLEIRPDPKAIPMTFLTGILNTSVPSCARGYPLTIVETMMGSDLLANFVGGRKEGNIYVADDLAEVHWNWSLVQVYNSINYHYSGIATLVKAN